MNVSASSVLMSAGSISVRLGAARPARSLFQYWNNAIDPSSFMPAAPRNLSPHVPSVNRRAPPDGLYGFRSMSRASPLAGCSPVGDVKVNKGFRLCRVWGSGTQTALHGATADGAGSTKVKKDLRGELGARPAVQGK